jgi:hypothetical protein
LAAMGTSTVSVREDNLCVLPCGRDSPCVICSRRGGMLVCCFALRSSTSNQLVRVVACDRNACVVKTAFLVYYGYTMGLSRATPCDTLPVQRRAENVREQTLVSARRGNEGTFEAGLRKYQHRVIRHGGGVRCEISTRAKARDEVRGICTRSLSRVEL